MLVDQQARDEDQIHDAAWLSSARLFLDGLDRRTARVLAERVLHGAQKKPTLAQLGDELGVTRERIRQIEVRGRERIDGISPTGPYRSLVEQARDLAQDLGPIFTTSELREALGLPKGSGEHELQIELLLFVADQFDRQGEFLIDRQFRTEVLAKLGEALRSGETREETVRNVLTDLGVQEQHIAMIIEELPGIRAIDGRLVPWSGSLADKAVVILHLRREPMTVDEVIDAIGEGSRGTLINYFSNDDRFLRRGPKKWALSEWGGDRYVSLAGAITEELSRGDGELPLDALVRRLRERFEVSENSIMTMAATSPLFISEGSWVRLRRRDEPYVPNSAIDESPSCVVIDDAWAWRVIVNHDVLRGSGLIVPEPFAALAGLRPQSRLKFESAYGVIPLNWSAQNPAIGSIRRAAEALGAVANDLIFVRLDGEQLDFRLVRQDDLKPTSPRENLLLRLGQQPTESDWQARCAQAIGLPEHANRSEIDSLLEVRGDRDVLRLFRSALRASEGS